MLARLNSSEYLTRRLSTVSIAIMIGFGKIKGSAGMFYGKP